MTDQLERNHAVKNYETPAGKEIGIFKVANTSLYRIGFLQGGEVPLALSGMFTAPSKAVQAIESYLAKRERDENRNTKQVVKGTPTKKAS